MIQKRINTYKRLTKSTCIKKKSTRVDVRFSFRGNQRKLFCSCEKCSRVSTLEKSDVPPAGHTAAIRAAQLVREMHSPLNVSRQPLRKRDKSRRAIPSAISSRRVSRRHVGVGRRRRRSQNKVSNRIANPPANTPDIGPPVCSDRNVCAGRRNPIGVELIFFRHALP